MKKSSIRTVIIDGSNVAYTKRDEKRRPKLKNILDVIEVAKHIDDKLAHGFLLSAEKRVSQLEWRVEQLPKIVTKWSGVEIP